MRRTTPIRTGLPHGHRRFLAAAIAAVAFALPVGAGGGTRHAVDDAPAGRSTALTELVGAFTTRYSPGAPRVTNIKRAAVLLDGYVIRPGGVFSMNRALGRRTTARGFVPAPMIVGGRLVDSVGGGISQVATTLYNAAFFAGLELVEHTPHSFYIPRYPAGREATISWGGPELVFRNDWPAPVRLRLTATNTAITVRLYSKRVGRSVVSWTGPRYAHVAPRTLVVVNRGLAPGARRLVQEAGQPGFTIEYGRSVRRGVALRTQERFRTRYEPQNAIVEVGPTRPGR